MPQVRTKMKTHQNKMAMSMQIYQKVEGQYIYEVLKEFDPSVNLIQAEEELKSPGSVKRRSVKTKCLKLTPHQKIFDSYLNLFSFSTPLFSSNTQSISLQIAIEAHFLLALFEKGGKFLISFNNINVLFYKTHCKKIVG